MSICLIVVFACGWWAAGVHKLLAVYPIVAQQIISVRGNIVFIKEKNHVKVNVPCSGWLNLGLELSVRLHVQVQVQLLLVESFCFVWDWDLHVS